MSPLLSNILVAAAVTVAALLMGRRAWRTVRGSKTGCGCERCPALGRGTVPSAASPPAVASAPSAPSTSSAPSTVAGGPQRGA